MAAETKVPVHLQKGEDGRLRGRVADRHAQVARTRREGREQIACKGETDDDEDEGEGGERGEETVLGHGVRVDDGVETPFGQTGVEGISQIVGLIGQFGLETLGSARVGGTRVAAGEGDRGEGILPAESQSVQRRVGIDVLQVVERLVSRLAQMEAGASQTAIGEETKETQRGVVLQDEEE